MESTILNFLEGIIIIGVIVVILAMIFGSENVQTILSRNLTEEIMLSADSTATIPQPEVIGATSFYDVNVFSTIKVISRLTESQNVIAIIRFKDHSIVAQVDGGRDFFTINPSDGTVQHSFHIDFSSEIPPITTWRDIYDDDLREGHQILVKSNSGAVLVSTTINTVWAILPDMIDYSDCKATFLLKSGCGPGQVKVTGPMIGYNCEEEPSNCRQSIGICGGVATVSVDSKPDCESNKVRTTIEYRDGKEFNAGELVYISFWKDTTCARQSKDPKSLLVLCPKDRLGGEFTINAGILPGSGA